MAEADLKNPPSEGETLESEKTLTIHDNLDAGGDTADDQLNESYKEAARVFLAERIEAVCDRIEASSYLLKNSLPSQKEEQYLNREAADNILGNIGIDVFPKETNGLPSEMESQLLHQEAADNILGNIDIDVFPKETNDDGLKLRPKKKHFLKNIFLRFTRRNKKAHVDADEIIELEKAIPQVGLPQEAQENIIANEIKATKKANRVKRAIRRFFFCWKPEKNPT